MTPAQPRHAAGTLQQWLRRDHHAHTLLDVTDNDVRRAAHEQQAVADALASLAPLHAEVIAWFQGSGTRIKRGR